MTKLSFEMRLPSFAKDPDMASLWSQQQKQLPEI